MEIYERNINSRVTKLDERRLLTEASLLDLNHSMRVALTINRKTRTIEKATAHILKAPLSICDGTTELMSRLVGLKLERGINRKLVDALSRGNGCTHLYELSLNAVRLTFNVMIGMDFDWNEWITRSIPEGDFIKKAMPHLENSCRPFEKKKPERRGTKSFPQSSSQYCGSLGRARPSRKRYRS